MQAFSVKIQSQHRVMRVCGCFVEFWQGFIRHKLGVHLTSTASEADLKPKLQRLKHQAVVTAGAVNVLWLVLILVLEDANATNLRLLGTNPLGVAFLLIYGLLFIIQFLCMLIHRYGTFMQYIANISISMNIDVSQA
eukprot:TRINITY_DN8068_c0_g1_i3.p1 TRINITY_DN8068_c0_g1~~TRINITY_DN8068_c0_g1_i3.p1  ORF type:complete len:137 (+),score=24.43 TRINITY_DN8068_c0_g1_i3:107-517(+)